MADLKMVTERELTQSGYVPLTDMIKSDYCPTASDFKNNWKKDGYVIKDVNGREDDELFALSDISAEAKLMLFENDIVFSKGDKNLGASDGFCVSAATSLTSFSIEMFYDANCTNSTNCSWSLTEDLSNQTFTQNGITYRPVNFTGHVPYNNTNNERYLYFKITGSGIGISETDVFKVRQLDYNDVKPTWDLLYYGINFKYNEGPGSWGQFKVTDEANKGWILEYPDFMELSPTGGTGEATITYYPKSTNETTTQRQGRLYLKSTDDIMIYNDCMVTQDARPSMIIHFNGMRDLGSLTFDGKYLYIANFFENIVFLLGDDFVPTASTKSVTISKDLINIIKSIDYEALDANDGEGWFICACEGEYDAGNPLKKQGKIMANDLNGFNVLNKILTAWDNGDESVTITVFYAEEVVFVYPTWNLTTASTLELSSAGTDVNFTVTDDDYYGYSFSADSSECFFDIYDKGVTKLDWTTGTGTGGTNDYILRVKNNTGTSRSEHVYLVYENQYNGDEIKNGVLVQQNAYVEPPKMGEVYSIYSNGYHSPTQLTGDIRSTAITANNITVEIEWAPNKNYKETGFLIPIFGYEGPSETRIYAEYISGDTYRIHLKVRDKDISGATINAAKLTSSNLCTIVHKITDNGKTHSISINNAYGSTTTTNTVATAASFYSIWAGGVINYSPESNPYSYFGNVKLTVGNDITLWNTWTTNGTTCGWTIITDIRGEVKIASNYTPGPYRYS